jgi:hypothetical protein
VLPLGVALVLARRWRVIAGWATAGAALLIPTLLLSPRWIFDWLGQTRSTVQTGAREIDFPHVAVGLPGSLQGVALALLTIVAIAAVVWLAWRRRADFQAAAAVVIAGGVLAAPHALPADLVLVALALAVSGQARWYEWFGLSFLALVCALAPVPVPTLVGVAVVVWVCLRAAGVITWRPPAPVPATAR